MGRKKARVAPNAYEFLASQDSDQEGGYSAADFEDIHRATNQTESKPPPPAPKKSFVDNVKEGVISTGKRVLSAAEENVGQTYKGAASLLKDYTGLDPIQTTGLVGYAGEKIYKAVKGKDSDITAKIGQAITDHAKSYRPDDAGFTAGLKDAVGGLLPFLGEAAAMGPYGAIAAQVSSMYGSRLDEYRAKGMNEAEAKERAKAMLMVDIPAMFAGGKYLGKAISAVPGAKTGIGQAVSTALQGTALGEAVGMGSKTAEQAMTGEKITPLKNAEEALPGALAMGGTGVLSHGVAVKMRNRYKATLDPATGKVDVALDGQDAHPDQPAPPKEDKDVIATAKTRQAEVNAQRQQQAEVTKSDMMAAEAQRLSGDTINQPTVNTGTVSAEQPVGRVSTSPEAKVRNAVDSMTDKQVEALAAKMVEMGEVPTAVKLINKKFGKPESVLTEKEVNLVDKYMQAGPPKPKVEPVVEPPTAEPTPKPLTKQQQAYEAAKARKGQPLEPAVEAEPPKVDRSKQESLVPAVKGIDGKVYEGKEGQRHIDILMENRDKGLTPDERINKSEKEAGDGRGFVAPDGKFLNRKQAAAWLKKNEKATWENLPSKRSQEWLHSEDFNSAREQGKPATQEAGVKDFEPHADLVTEAKFKSHEEAHKAFKEEAHPEEKPEHFLRRKICGG